MRLDFNEDQITFMTFLEQMLGSAEAEFRTVKDWGRFDHGLALETRLVENGFFDAAAEEDLGPVAAAAMINEVAQTPVALECAASAMLRPFLGTEVPRPLAVIADDARGAIRYLPMARTLVSVSAKKVAIATLPEGAVTAVNSLFAYPMGTVDHDTLEWHTPDCDPAKLYTLWQIAISAELCGVLTGAIASVLAHVRERHQFGQPLGSFQAVQHRLATNAIEIEAARLQVLKAADSLSPQDAAAALGYVQGFATRAGYDLHQFMGAMGLTLEHPLHRWTYRARLLRADMGGSTAAYQTYATQRWGAA